MKLIPDELIAEAIEFESQDPGFAGEMTITVILADVEGGRLVSMRNNNLPPGIRPEDNETGMQQPLRNLAALVE